MPYRYERNEVVNAVLESAYKAALETALRFLLDKANQSGDKIVPMSDKSGGGYLRDSSGIDIDDSGLYGVVYYTAFFAARIHESLELHFHGEPLRGAKWLEECWNTYGQEALEIFAAELRRQIGD